MPTIRSGSRAATASTLSSTPFGLSSSGSASPSSSCAHGHVPNGCSPYQSRMPTGMTPSASNASWSLKPTETTRVGSASIVVDPYLCSIVTGNAASLSATVEPAVVTSADSVQAAVLDVVVTTAGASEQGRGGERDERKGRMSHRSFS